MARNTKHNTETKQELAYEIHFLANQNDLVMTDNALLLNEIHAVGSLLHGVLSLVAPVASPDELGEAMFVITEIAEDFQNSEILATYIAGIISRQHLSLPLKDGELALVTAKMESDSQRLSMRLFPVPSCARPSCTKRLAVDRDKMMSRLVDGPVDSPKEDSNG
jgi:hypothetical protein